MAAVLLWQMVPFSRARWVHPSPNDSSNVNPALAPAHMHIVDAAGGLDGLGLGFGMQVSAKCYHRAPWWSILRTLCQSSYPHHTSLASFRAVRGRARM